MSINLKKNQSIDLRKNADNSVNNLSQVIIGLGWDIKRGESDYDLDACALLLKDNKLTSSDDIVSYQNKRHKSSTIWSTGDNLTGEGDGDDEQIIVKLDSVPAEYNKIVFYATIYNGRSRGQEFSKVENAFIRAVDAGNKEIAKYNISNDPNASGKRSLVFGEAIRNGQNWEFRATGEYYNTDNLVDVAEMYKSGQNNPEERKKLFGLF
ncbi:MAG: TerD family protein [Spirochaetes bacterium]|nr:MAG: TerD family protein [Spirochaetota bacterium]